MAWTDDRIAVLEKMWGDGQSAAEIAKTLGEGVTRNAVIGKAHRMGLSGRPSPIKKATAAKKATKKAAPKVAKEKTTTKAAAKAKEAEAAELKEKMASAKKLVKAPAPIKPAPRKIANIKDGEYTNILDLTDRVCKWPIGDPRNSDFHFCVEPSPPGTPYCNEHTAMAYQVSTRGRKKK